MKAVIFDFNGTLLFDTPKHALAWDAFARRYCGRALSAEEYRDRLAGKDNRTTMEYLLGRPVDEEELRSLSHDKEEFYFSLCREDPDFALAPGAAEFLEELRRRGVPYMIATSAGAANIDFYYRQLDLGRWFDRESQLVFADGKIPSKPDPALYLLAMKRLGLPPKDCLIFEDLPTGIAAGAASGAGAVVAVASGQSAEALESLPGVLYAVSDFTDWPRFFREGLL